MDYYFEESFTDSGGGGLSLGGWADQLTLDPGLTSGFGWGGGFQSGWDDPFMFDPQPSLFHHSGPAPGGPGRFNSAQSILGELEALGTSLPERPNGGHEPGGSIRQ